MLQEVNADKYVYTPCYCEENVYKLCERLLDHSAELHAVFVSNVHKQVSPHATTAGIAYTYLSTISIV